MEPRQLQPRGGSLRGAEHRRRADLDRAGSRPQRGHRWSGRPQPLDGPLAEHPLRLVDLLPERRPGLRRVGDLPAGGLASGSPERRLGGRDSDTGDRSDRVRDARGFGQRRQLAVRLLRGGGRRVVQLHGSRFWNAAGIHVQLERLLGHGHRGFLPHPAGSRHDLHGDRL